MGRTSQKNRILAAVLCLAAIQLVGVGMSPMLAQMNHSFPDAEPSRIQLVSTMPNLTLAVTALIVAKVSSLVPHKYLAALGSFLACLFAVLGFAFHGSLGMLYVWSGILGAAAGITNNVGTYIINDAFSREERVTVLGYQSLSASLGAMIMTFVGGRLVNEAWFAGYLVYLIMIPALVLSLVFLPANIRQTEAGAAEEASRKNTDWKAISILVLISFFFGICYNTSNANLAMLLEEEHYGMAGTAGTLLSVIMLCSGLMGAFVGRIAKKLGIWTIALGLTLLTGGYLILCLGGSLAGVVIGGIAAGISITCIMPIIVSNASDYGGRNAPLAMTLGTLGSQIGTLISPGVSDVAAWLFHSGEVRYRYLFATILGALVLVFTIISIRFYFTRTARAVNAKG